MTHDVLVKAETVSALMDGQLRGEEFAATVELLTEDAYARTTWHAYHLVGDVLRSGQQAAVSGFDAAFVGRLRQRLQEPAQDLQPGAAMAGKDAGFHFYGGRSNDRPVSESANEARFGWKLVASFASLAAVTMLGWQLIAVWGGKGGAAELTQRLFPASVLSASADEQQQVMIRDPRLDQLLAAHQQLGGTSALQMPAGFLRNATFEKPAR